MRKFFRLTGLCAMMLGLMISCDPDEPEVTLNAPTGLTVGTLTATTAQLSWTAVDGAAGYNVVINDGTPAPVTAASYQATGLTPETDYTWKVQAVQGDVVSEWSAASDFTTPAEGDTTEVPVPTNLNVSDVTNNSATFTWQHADADSHELVLNDGAAVPVTALTYTATDLTPETAYTWKVRSSKDGVWSAWADGEGFTTLEEEGGDGEDRVQFVFADVYSYYGDYYGSGSENFGIHFQDEAMFVSGTDGWDLGIDFAFAAADMNMDPSVEILDIPEGTYNISSEENMAPYMFCSDYSALIEFDGGDDTEYGLTDGTITISGDRTGYHITFDLVLEDGSTFLAEYNGPYYLPNPNYEPVVGDLEFVEASFLEYGDEEYGVLRDYYLSLFDISYVTYGGIGYTLGVDLYAPASGTSNSIIPDGTYTVGEAGEPSDWGIDPYYGGLVYSGIEQTFDVLVSGTVTTLKTGDDTYTITTDLVLDSGLEVKETYSGTVTSQSPTLAPSSQGYMTTSKVASKVASKSHKPFGSSLRKRAL